MGCKNTKINSNDSSESGNEELLVYGYIRSISKELNINIPMELLSIFFLSYHNPYIRLQFSDKHRTINGFALIDGKKTAIRIKTGPYHSHIYVNCKPVFNGIHCWRFNIKNSYNAWIGFYVSAPNLKIKKYSFNQKTGNCYIITIILNASAYL